MLVEWDLERRLPARPSLRSLKAIRDMANSLKQDCQHTINEKLRKSGREPSWSHHYYGFSTEEIEHIV
jgi:hypothetical protein